MKKILIIILILIIVAAGGWLAYQNANKSLEANVNNEIAKQEDGKSPTIVELNVEPQKQINIKKSHKYHRK